MMDWNLSTYFTQYEFKCSHTGQCDMDPEFIRKLNELRTAFGKPRKITSGYRHTTHPIERKKKTPGAHTTGQAADIAVSRQDAFHLLRIALSKGFTGVGIQQKNLGRFIHLDTIEHSPERPRPTIWSY